MSFNEFSVALVNALELAFESSYETWVNFLLFLGDIYNYLELRDATSIDKEKLLDTLSAAILSCIFINGESPSHFSMDLDIAKKRAHIIYPDDVPEKLISVLKRLNWEVIDDSVEAD